MSITNVMVAVDRSERIANRLLLARDLAGRFGAGITGIGARLADSPRMIYGDSYPIVMPDLRKAAEDDIAALGSTFETTMAGFDRAEWRGDIQVPLRFAVEQSRAADLVVVGRQGADDFVDLDFGVDPGDLVLAAGRPILVVPPWMTELRAHRIVMAWRDTREARRALKDALPFMKNAAEVSVIEVGSGAASSNAVRDVARFLAGHGVTATLQTLEQHDLSVEEVILQHASYMEADLVVSGAYGHGRLRETVFGGVTRGLLRYADVCCLMSH